MVMSGQVRLRQFFLRKHLCLESFGFFQSLIYLNASTPFILKISATIDCRPLFTKVRPWKVPKWGTKYEDYASKEEIRYGFNEGTTSG